VTVEHMKIRTELWPIMADKRHLWLVSGEDAWRPEGPVLQDWGVHNTIIWELAAHGIRPMVNPNEPDEYDWLRSDRLEPVVPVLHSTSWNEADEFTVTYVAGLLDGESVLDRWPGARPIDLNLAEKVGPPLTHASTSPPELRIIDTLLHGARHLAFLNQTDATAAADLPPLLRHHISTLTPALAGMYRTIHGNSPSRQAA
jgi:hypothetical protein